MSRFHGRQRCGADHEQRQQRRLQAECRNDTTITTRKTPAPETTERDCE